MSAAPKKRFPSCILATCCVPWNPDGTLAEAVFRRSIQMLRDGLTQHLYLFGTAGEGQAVSDSQFDHIIQSFWEETGNGRAQPMVGIISLSLNTMIERIQRARSLGFRAFQISLPSWGALNPVEMRRFFDAVCGRFPDCQFLHYNLMRTKRLVTPEEYGQLAREFPNLVATKNATDSMDRIIALARWAPELQHFYTETGFGYAAQVGECGFLISIASMNFARAKQYFEASRAREAATLLAMQQQLRNLTADFIAHLGDAAHMDGAYDKIFCKMHDPEFPLRLLPPYSDFGDEKFASVVEMIRKKYPDWRSA